MVTPLWSCWSGRHYRRRQRPSGGGVYVIIYFHAVSLCKLVIYSEEIYSYIMELISFIWFVVCTKISYTPFFIGVLYWRMSCWSLHGLDFIVQVVPLSYDVRVSAAKILTEVEEFEVGSHCHWCLYIYSPKKSDDVLVF